MGHRGSGEFGCGQWSADRRRRSNRRDEMADLVRTAVALLACRSTTTSCPHTIASVLSTLESRDTPLRRSSPVATPCTEVTRSPQRRHPNFGGLNQGMPAKVGGGGRWCGGAAAEEVACSRCSSPPPRHTPPRPHHGGSTSAVLQGLESRRLQPRKHEDGPGRSGGAVVGEEVGRARRTKERGGMRAGGGGGGGEWETS